MGVSGGASGGGGGGVGPAGPPGPTVFTYFQPGTLTVSAGSNRLFNDTGRTLTISSVRANVITAPGGAAVIVDVKKNGVTVFTTQANRPTIASGATTSGRVPNPDVNTIVDGEYLTVDVAQIGSTTAGSDLTIQIVAS